MTQVIFTTNCTPITIWLRSACSVGDALRTSLGLE